MPEPLSLGREVADWITEYLPLPTGEPFVLTPEEVRFLLAWYRVDEQGRFTYRRGLLQQPKGWGKSPLAAAVCLAEFAGSTLPAGLDATGQPVGKPWPVPWCQVAAVSVDQANANVYSILWSMLEADHGRAAGALGIDEGRTRLFRTDSPGAKVEAVTSAAQSREGQRVTFGLMDESWSWVPSNGGRKLAETIRRNAAKAGGRTLETSNAYQLGSESVAEMTAVEAESGRPGILYIRNQPSKVPTEEMTDAELRLLLEEVYGDAKWLDLDRVIEELRDVSNPFSESKRFYFNVPSPGSASAVSPKDWETLARPEGTPEGDVWAGFVGSDTSAALIACAEVDGKPYLFPVGIWNEPGQRVPRQEVHAGVNRMVNDYNVVAFYVDPRDWVDEAEDWADRYAETPDEILAWPTTSRQRFGPALQAFLVAVKEQGLTHSDDPALTAAVLGSVLRPSGDVQMLAPAGPGRRIEAARAAVAALRCHAERPKRPRKRGFLVMDSDWVPPRLADDPEGLEAWRREQGIGGEE